MGVCLGHGRPLSVSIKHKNNTPPQLVSTRFGANDGVGGGAKYEDSRYHIFMAEGRIFGLSYSHEVSNAFRKERPFLFSNCEAS